NERDRVGRARCGHDVRAFSWREGERRITDAAADDWWIVVERTAEHMDVITRVIPLLSGRRPGRHFLGAPIEERAAIGAPDGIVGAVRGFRQVLACLYVEDVQRALFRPTRGEAVGDIAAIGRWRIPIDGQMRMLIGTELFRIDEKTIRASHAVTHV